MNQPSDFCPSCGNLVEMPLLTDKIECYQCKGSFSIFDYPPQPIISLIQFKDKKPWLEKYNKKMGINQKQKTKEQIEEENNSKNEDNLKATINQQCPKCQHPRMYFWTVQIRSVDEGSTVFYKCMKCEHTITQNN